MADHSLGSMSVGLGLNMDGLVSGFAAARQSISGFAGVATGLLAGVGVAAVGAGVASVKMAADFQSGLTALVTGAGESQKNLKTVSDGILNLADITATSTKNLSDGMYMIESAGYHGAAGLTVLKAAAEGAKVGNADLASVANGVTTAMTDYAKSHLTAAQATNDLIATVASGKTHMSDLSTAMSTILPTSSAVGVSLYDTSAAMATMTGEGTNAASAATYLRQLLMALEAPAKKGADALKAIGLSTKQVSDDMRKSLPDTLQMITDHLAKKFPVGSAAYIDALKNIAGGSKQMQGILELTGSHLSVLKGNFESITQAVKKGGSAITGWNLVQEDFNFKLDQAKEALEVFAIKLGTGLLPLFSQLLTGITPLIEKMSTFATLLASKIAVGFELISHWLVQYILPYLNQLKQYFESPTITNLAKQIGDIIGRAFQLLGQILSNVVLPLFVKLVEWIGNTVAAIVDFIDHFNFTPLITAAQGFWRALMQVWQVLQGPLSQVASSIGAALKLAFTIALDALTGLFEGIATLLTQAQPYIQAFADFFSRTIGAAVNGVIGLVNKLLAFAGKPTIQIQVAGGGSGTSSGSQQQSYPQPNETNPKNGKPPWWGMDTPSGGGEPSWWSMDKPTQQLNIFQQAWRNLTQAIKPATDALGGFIQGLGERLKPIIDNSRAWIQGIGDLIHWWITTLIPDWFGALGNGLVKAWSTVWPTIKPFLNALWTGVWESVRDGIKIAGDLLYIGLDIIGLNWQKAWSDMGLVLVDIWNGLKDTFGNFLQSLLQLILFAIQPEVNAITLPFKLAWQIIQPILSQIMDFFNWVSNVGGTLLFGNTSQSTQQYWQSHPKPTIPGFASGVTNFSGGLAYVHAGELLVNLAPGTSVIPAGHGGAPQEVVVNNYIQLEGQQIGNAIVNSMRLRTGGHT